MQRENPFPLKNAKRRFQVDWMISNLRWLLLVSVALVSFTDIFINRGGTLEPADLLSQILLLTLAALYNLGVMLLLSYDTLRRAVPVMTLLIDTILTIGFVLTSGGLKSPLLFFALFPVLTAALRFRWGVSLLIAVVVVVGCGFVGYAIASPDELWSDLVSFGARALVLLLATLVSALVADRVKQLIGRTLRLEEEAELRKLRAAHENARVVFELASTLSATLNYNRVLETMLDVGETGMRELGRPDPAYVGLVILFGQQDLRIVASRHLPARDQNTVFKGQVGALAQALRTAEAVIIDDPGSDPELGQLIVMHSCRQAIVLPLRAGFENFGAVIFGSPQSGTYTERHKDLLIAICNQAIVALKNAQLYQSLMEEKERIVAVEEDARKKLARDLHDGPTQGIAAIAMRVNYARMLLKKDPTNVDAELAHVEELARRTTKEIRHMLFTLRPLILETQGLRVAIKQHISKLAETDDLSIHLEATPETDRVLDRNTQGVIFYILEEAIGNARKHAEADNLWVRLYLQDGNFVAEVEDDGVGFDVDTVQLRYDERGSLGMINMHERAQLVGGKLTIASAPGEGTRVALTVPLPGR